MKHTSMRNHIQGIGLLLFLVLGLWGLSQVAGPALSDAFGDDGAVSAESPEGEDTIDLTIGGEESAELTAEEIEELQFGLFIEGFLASTNDIDGAQGPTTNAAMDAARERYELVDATDRALYEHVTAILAENPFFNDAP